MSHSNRLRTPSYRLHRPSGQAVVTLNGRDFYLGTYGTDASRAEYDRLIAEWLANARVLRRPAGGSPDLTVNELILAYWRHAEQHYRMPDGTVTSELSYIQLAMRPLRRLYGHTPAAWRRTCSARATPRLSAMQSSGATARHR